MQNIANNLPWDLKATLNKVKNAVMNYTEMEAKVREATSNDPWGASSTLLQTLQLVEYLLKNGSERAIENIKDHSYEIRCFTSFNFIDDKGKDQGINVRHRAKELTELIGDNSRLREERQKAQANRNKYQGVSAEEARFSSFGSSSVSPHQYVSSTSFSSNSQSQRNQQAKDNDYDYEVPVTKKTSEDLAEPPSLQKPVVIMASNNSSAAANLNQQKQETSANHQNNLLDFDFSSSAPAANNNNFGSNTAGVSQNVTSPHNEFDDFQSAPMNGNIVPTNQSQLYQSSGPQMMSSQLGFYSAPQSRQIQPTLNQQPIMGIQPLMQQNHMNQRSMVGMQPSMPQQPIVGLPQQSSNLGVFNGFVSSPPPTSVPSQVMAPVSNWSSIASAPSQQAQASLASSSINGPPKKIDDIWSSNLVSLDSLGKFNSNQPKIGPSMHQIATQQQNFQAQQMPFQQPALGVIPNNQPTHQQQSQQQLRFQQQQGFSNSFGTPGSSLL